MQKIMQLYQCMVRRRAQTDTFSLFAFIGNFGSILIYIYCEC